MDDMSIYRASFTNDVPVANQIEELKLFLGRKYVGLQDIIDALLAQEYSEAAL